MWASRGKDRYWIALSFMGDGPQEEPAQWGISVDAVRGLSAFFRKADPQTLGELRDRIKKILASNSAIKSIEA